MLINSICLLKLFLLELLPIVLELQLLTLKNLDCMKVCSLPQMNGVRSRALSLFNDAILMSVEVCSAPIFENLIQNHALYQLKSFPQTRSKK